MPARQNADQPLTTQLPTFAQTLARILTSQSFTGASSASQRFVQMTDSSASFLAVLFGVGVFAVIVAIGWRSVQNRRIVRLQGADGQETVIIAGEDDEITSIATTTNETTQPATAQDASVGVVDTEIADPHSAPEFGRKVDKSATVIDV